MYVFEGYKFIGLKGKSLHNENLIRKGIQKIFQNFLCDLWLLPT